MNDFSRIEGVVAPARFSIDQFMRMLDAQIFEGSKVELVDGEVVQMSLPMSTHMIYNRQVHLKLNEIFRENEHGYIVVFSLSLQLGERTLREVDVGVIPPFDEGQYFPQPDGMLLAVEVSVTTLEHDLSSKKRDYAKSDIPHYWVIDPEERNIHVFGRPFKDDYLERHLIDFGQPLRVPGTDRTITID